MINLFKIPTVYAATKTPEEIVGEINVPKGVDVINESVKVTGDGPAIGVILFMSNMVKLLMIGGGIILLYNIISVAFLYFTSGGKTDVNVKVKDKLTMSIIGILLMIVSYSVAALIGYVVYGDPTFILSPKIEAL